MSELVLAVWDMAPGRAVEATVLPDGCRDLIMHWAPGGRPHWFVSPLTGQAYTVAVEAGTVMRGFRLRPGVHLAEAALLDAVQGREWGLADIRSRLADHGHLLPQVAEALECLASGAISVAGASTMLGVGPRSLQRLLSGATGESPAFWLQLARARQAARAVLAPGSLAELADACGYADQAHMTRDFRRWFATTPSQMRRNPALARVVAAPGYG